MEPSSLLALQDRSLQHERNSLTRYAQVTRNELLFSLCCCSSTYIIFKIASVGLPCEPRGHRISRFVSHLSHADQKHDGGGSTVNSIPLCWPSTFSLGCRQGYASHSCALQIREAHSARLPPPVPTSRSTPHPHSLRPQTGPYADTSCSS